MVVSSAKLRVVVIPAPEPESSGGEVKLNSASHCRAGIHVWSSAQVSKGARAASLNRTLSLNKVSAVTWGVW